GRVRQPGRQGIRHTAIRSHGGRRVHEPGSGEALQKHSPGLEKKPDGRGRSYRPSHAGRGDQLPRPQRPRNPGVGVQPRTAHPRPGAQADQKDRRGHYPPGQPRLRLLRRLRGRDRGASSGGAPDCDPLHRLQDPRRDPREAARL
ncbi:MAG: RNA polymerase-binding transcription factor DksA, partial [Olavius algarvensis Gamma 1 endosymbiont]